MLSAECLTVGWSFASLIFNCEFPPADGTIECTFSKVTFWVNILKAMSVL